MAIAFDAATDGGNNGGTTNSRTSSHTSTGSNLIGFVGIEGDLITGGADDITSVTWDGNACTFIAKNTTNVLAGTTRYSYLYYIAGPPTGAKNIVVSCTANHFLLVGSLTYTGASQTGIPDASIVNATALSTDLTLTTAITTVADNCWTVLMETGNTAGAGPNAGTGTAKRTQDAAFFTWGLFDSNAAITPAGSYSMNTTRNSGSSGGITHVIASFTPAGAAPSALSVIANN